jgi:hypothetical protein
MDHTQYGIRHHALPVPIPMMQSQARAVVAAWPEATLVRRESRNHKGVTGTHATWTPWEEPGEPAEPGGVPAGSGSAVVTQQGAAIAGRPTT